MHWRYRWLLGKVSLQEIHLPPRSMAKGGFLNLKYSADRKETSSNTQGANAKNCSTAGCWMFFHMVWWEHQKWGHRWSLGERVMAAKVIEHGRTKRSISTSPTNTGAFFGYVPNARQGAGRLSGWATKTDNHWCRTRPMRWGYIWQDAAEGMGRDIEGRHILWIDD